MTTRYVPIIRGKKKQKIGTIVQIAYETLHAMESSACQTLCYTENLSSKRKKLHCTAITSCTREPAIRMRW